MAKETPQINRAELDEGLKVVRKVNEELERLRDAGILERRRNYPDHPFRPFQPAAPSGRR